MPTTTSPETSTGAGAPAGVRKGRAEETPRLARVLARAFETDPLFSFVLPDESTRLGRLELMFRRISVPDALDDDGCWTTADCAGVALWAPAGRDVGLVEPLWLVPEVARIFGRRSVTALRTLSYLESQVPGRPHAHLLFLGTAPEHQGRGVGSLVLRSMLDSLDRAGTPAYLVASTPRSRELYLRHGFVDLSPMSVPGGGPTLWPMWREPAGDVMRGVMRVGTTR